MGNVARDFARALDPVQTAIAAGYKKLDPKQEEFLRSDEPRHLLNWCRQSGKSTMCAIRAVHDALYDPGLILLLAPALRQSTELFRKVLEVYHALDDVPKIKDESALRLELRNGARIVALPGTEATIRGFSAARRIIVDEASRVADGLFASVRPMLATTQGSFTALSTPYGKRGWWHEAWTNGEGWHRTQVTALECPRIDKGWLAGERKLIGDWQYRQEYMCEFVDTDEQFFSSALIEAALSTEVQPLWRP